MSVPQSNGSPKHIYDIVYMIWCDLVLQVVQVLCEAEAAWREVTLSGIAANPPRYFTTHTHILPVTYIELCQPHWLRTNTHDMTPGKMCVAPAGISTHFYLLPFFGCMICTIRTNHARSYLFRFGDTFYIISTPVQTDRQILRCCWYGN